MMTLTGHERMANILQRKPVDRIGVFEHFWDDTHRAWSEAGHLAAGESFEDHFGYDMQLCWANEMVADLDFVPEVIEETDETILRKDGNGAFLRRHKQHDTTPEHVDFSVKERAAWEELIKPKLTADPRRIHFDWYREAKRQAAADRALLLLVGDECL